MIFCSGQVAKDPTTGEVVTGDLEAQTKQVLDNLKAVLESAGSSLEKVVKVTVFLTDMTDFEKMNEVYKTYFSKDPPTRACVEISNLASEEYMVEIECVATS